MEETSAAFGLENLHTETELAHGLFRDGHLQEAIRKAAERYVNRLAQEAERPDLQGTSLVNHAFSEDNPVLVLNSHETPDDWTLIDRDEHNGYRFLGVGLVQAVRNVMTHADDYDLTTTEALEWMAFISAMHRRLDGAQQFVAAPEAEPQAEA